jgi:ceramide glucosyltransferase
MMVVAGILAVASIAGILFQSAAAILVRRWMSRTRIIPDIKPPVTILKPLSGDEPGLSANLRTFLALDYPAFDIVFGVKDANDAALGVVASLDSVAPWTSRRVVIDPAPRGLNMKVSNLLNMMPHAAHEIIVIADADIAVDRRYLDDLAAPLADPAVGLVTCLYVGKPTGGIWSSLGAAGINHGFLPAALVARALGRKDGCFGATMALRKDVLQRIGGLESVRDLLADDWALGQRVRQAGLSIALAARPVDIVVHEPSLGHLFRHELRWARTVAALDRPAYIGSILTQPVPLAVLAAVAGHGKWPFLVILAAALAAFWAAVRSEERALSLPRMPVFLLGFRAVLSFAVYLGACFGRTVWWRGRKFRVRHDGSLESLKA